MSVGLGLGALGGGVGVGGGGVGWVVWGGVVGLGGGWVMVCARISCVKKVNTTPLKMIGERVFLMPAI